MTIFITNSPRNFYNDYNRTYKVTIFWRYIVMTEVERAYEALAKENEKLRAELKKNKFALSQMTSMMQFWKKMANDYADQFDKLYEDWGV